MRAQATQLTRQRRRGDVCVVEGYDVQVRVRRGRLVVVDGIADERRERMFSRALPGISRLVLLGHAGFITLEAVRWCADVGVALIHIDRDGRVLATSAAGVGDSRLRRAQSLVRTTATGLEIAHTILRQKLNGQQQVLTQLDPTPGEIGAFAGATADLERADTIEQLVWAERDAALAYWSAWTGVQARFRSSEATLVPEHWLQFGQRHSPLTGAPRLAANPLNALLNYLYALLEAETRIACLIVGLDPGLGIVHADYRTRDSFVLDLMEAGRPAVDQYVLDLARERRFRSRDFGETRRGVCRLLAPLGHELAATAAVWRRLMSPIVEGVAGRLADAPGSRVAPPPTPLTGSRRNAAQDHKRRPRELRPPKPWPACKRCGKPVPHRDRTYCDICLTLPQAVRRASVGAVGDSESPVRRTSRRCKSCGDPVSHRKRVYCDPCFALYQEELAGLRRRCKTCGDPVRSRKRVYCDRCFAA